MTGADIGEIAEVDDGDRDDRQPLAHRDQGSVGPARVPVGVASHELSHAAQVCVGQDPVEAIRPTLEDLGATIVVAAFRLASMTCSSCVRHPMI
jgi:hypothetical protein